MSNVSIWIPVDTDVPGTTAANEGSVCKMIISVPPVPCVSASHAAEGCHNTDTPGIRYDQSGYPIPDTLLYVSEVRCFRWFGQDTRIPDTRYPLCMFVR
jgi:hypothetical protein